MTERKVAKVVARTSEPCEHSRSSEVIVQCAFKVPLIEEPHRGLRVYLLIPHSVEQILDYAHDAYRVREPCMRARWINEASGTVLPNTPESLHRRRIDDDYLESVEVNVA